MADEAIFVKVDETIPLKRAIARSLYRKNIDQSKISKILKLSQPMVSNYLNVYEKIPKNILILAEKISEKIINRNLAAFYTCISFNNKSLKGSFYIARKDEIISDEKNKIIDNLTEAFLLIKGKNIKGFIPEIKINIAMAKDNAEKPEDVASFLNGLIIADDIVISNNGIRFGKSKHLSSLILSLRKTINVNAIMNVAYINNVEKISFNYSYLTKNFKLESNKKNVDVLLHRGDFGIEPCAYILGKNAMDVVKKVMKLKEELT